MAIEQPYKGRAVIEDTYSGVTITIPAKRNYFIMLFMMAWLGGWVMGEGFALRTLFGDTPDGVDTFVLFWLCGWTIGGGFVISILVWMLIGKEVITIDRGVLSISKKGYLLGKTKSYSIAEMGNFEIRDSDDIQSFLGSRRNNSIPPFGQKRCY